MSSSTHALVAGAGLAGLATAKVLHDLGWTVDLVERRQAFDAIPTGLFLHANGMRAFAALGAAAALRARGRDIERLRMRSADGSTQGVADLTSVWPGVGPSVTIDRGLSLQALMQWCPVAVRMGLGVQKVSERGHRVEAALSDGSATEYDLVVGADGVYSTIRRQVWPDVDVRYGGESCWRGVVDCPPGLDDWDLCLCQQGTFLAMPIGRGLAYWVAVGYSARPFEDPVNGRAARVQKRFGDVTGVHAQVLSQLKDDARIQFSPADEVWVDKPVHGRVVLLGDAGHGTTPSMAQGASMAAEDALVLARELAASPDTDEALARYAHRRVPRTRYVQETTAMRNRLAALPLQDRLGVIPAWAELSRQSFALLVPEP